MGPSFYNENPNIVVDYMDSYFRQKETDCSLYSEDGIEYPIHKELLCQTEFLCAIANSTNMETCSKLEIFIPSLSSFDLQHIIKFLYSGVISCSDQSDTFRIVKNLNLLFGFPESMDLCGAIKDEMQIENHEDTFSEENDKSYFISDYLDQSITNAEEEIDTKHKEKLKSVGQGTCTRCGKFFKKLSVHMERIHGSIFKEPMESIGNNETNINTITKTEPGKKD